LRKSSVNFIIFMILGRQVFFLKNQNTSKVRSIFTNLFFHLFCPNLLIKKIDLQFAKIHVSKWCWRSNECLTQWFSKWAKLLPSGTILRSKGTKKNKGGGRGAKQHKGGENPQPLIDHWVNFSRLLLWLDKLHNRWRLLLKQLSVKFLFLIVYVPGYREDYLFIFTRILNVILAS